MNTKVLRQRRQENSRLKSWVNLVGNKIQICIFVLSVHYCSMERSTASDIPGKSLNTDCWHPFWLWGYDCLQRMVTCHQKIWYDKNKLGKIYHFSISTEQKIKLKQKMSNRYIHRFLLFSIPFLIELIFQISINFDRPHASANNIEFIWRS